MAKEGGGKAGPQAREGGEAPSVRCVRWPSQEGAKGSRQVSQRRRATARPRCCGPGGVLTAYMHMLVQAARFMVEAAKGRDCGA